MSSSNGARKPFFPKADAAVLSSKRGPPPPRPQTVWPIYDPDNADKPIEPWAPDIEACFYPPKAELYAATPIPARPARHAKRYLRAFLAKDERLRLSMLWYYTRDMLKEDEFLSGLQEKADLAQESTGWEFAVIGILDVNFYIRLATVGLPLGILPRGETLCAHTVTQPPGSVFLLPNMMEDWRFQESPYVESGGLRAYAGAPLRLQNESGDCVSLGSLCVASGTNQKPLSRPQQQTLARLADWVVADIVQCARARRQRARRRMSELISTVQAEMGDAISEEPVLRILRTIYPNATTSLQSSKATHVEIEGRSPILLSNLEDGLWEDTEFLDDFITNQNHQELPSTRVVRVIAARCDSILGPSLLIVASKEFQLVFDDVDSWFIQTCASMISQMWHKLLLAEVMRTKEKFLRGVSHQLRTPIHGILGSVELLAEELKSNSMSALMKVAPVVNSGEPSIYLDTIKTAGRDLISIVNSMITLNRWTDIAMAARRYSMHTIQEVETELSNEILRTISGDTRYRASIFFYQELPRDCDSLRIDLNLLRDSLFPLVMNAIQNTPEGVVAVTTSILTDCRELIVDVDDNGRGIHPDHHQRIFEPYEKVDMHSTGAGLGLTLGSKFATLLHGSVSLVSSDIGRGSHFKATFREIECAMAHPPRQPLISRLESMPTKFYNMASGSIGDSLCNYFAKFLTCHGFTSSDNTEDSFIILDFPADLEQHRSYLTKVPFDQVAICLIPSSKEKVCFREGTPKNIVYVSGPFFTSTMSSALEEADRMLSEIRASRVRQAKSEEPSVELPNVDKSSSTDEGAWSVADLPDPKGLPTQPPADSSVDSGLDEAEPLKSLPCSVALKELVIPIFPAHQSSAKPAALLVDDNNVNLRIMQIYCSKRGLPYYCATDGKQAVEIFSQHQLLSTTGGVAPIELIFMDLQMPVCDGIEATQQIRTLEKQNMWKGSVLFIVTGQDSPTDRSAAKSAGADEYFVKPVGMKVLDRSVTKYFPAFNAK